MFLVCACGEMDIIRGFGPRVLGSSPGRHTKIDAKRVGGTTDALCIYGYVTIAFHLTYTAITGVTKKNKKQADFCYNTTHGTYI